MKKNGFTLIELIVSISIMALLFLVIIPLILNIRGEVLAKNCTSTKNDVSTAAKDWAYEHLNTIPTNGTQTCITIEDLINKGYLVGNRNSKMSLSNPVTEEDITNCEVCLYYTDMYVIDARTNSQTNKKLNTIMKSEFTKFDVVPGGNATITKDTTEDVCDIRCE